MENDPVMMDLAFIDDQKGRLFLYRDELVFQWKKGELRFLLSEIRNLNFEKKTFVTSTLFINDIAITVCRAHLWAGRIRELARMT